jgi:hypothetical protein
MRSPCSMSLYLYVPPHNGIVEREESAVARQRLRKHFAGATKTHEAIKELLNALFSMRSMPYQIFNMPYQRKVSD